MNITSQLRTVIAALQREAVSAAPKIGTMDEQRLAGVLAAYGYLMRELQTDPTAAAKDAIAEYRDYLEDTLGASIARHEHLEREAHAVRQAEIKGDLAALCVAIREGHDTMVSLGSALLVLQSELTVAAAEARKVRNDYIFCEGWCERCHQAMQKTEQNKRTGDKILIVLMFGNLAQLVMLLLAK